MLEAIDNFLDILASITAWGMLYLCLVLCMIVLAVGFVLLLGLELIRSVLPE